MRVAPVLSPRLELVSLRIEMLAASLAGDRQEAAALLGARIDDEWWPSTNLMQLWLDHLRQDPALLPWLARAIVRRSDRLMIGHMGGHGYPGAAWLEPYVRGGFEIGYTVFTPYRRQGYAREALGALMAWAVYEQTVSSIVLSISPTNRPSLALARHYAFQQVGTALDPVDGIEAIFVLSASEVAPLQLPATEASVPPDQPTPSAHDQSVKGDRPL